MKQMTIRELTDLFNSGEVTDHFVQELKEDSRKGVQQLIKKYENQQLIKEKQYEQLEMMSRYERKCFSKGYEYIAGVDEAGRGPLAGPVVAAAVILPENFELLGLTDSKQLNEQTRNRFYDIIKDQAISYGVSIISNNIIDEINIFEATKRSMYECLSKLNPQPDHALIDAVKLNELDYPADIIIKGDQKSLSIAAASVLAKVTRDNIMQQLHRKYPVYEFNRNMGYGTKRHLEMLEKKGVTPYHRKSYAPVRNVIDN